MYNCDFCDIDKMKNFIGEEECERWIYEDEQCYAILDENQYTYGHSIVILKDHVKDIIQEIRPAEKLHGFMKGVHEVSKMLIDIQNDNREKPEKIYVCSLGEGIDHLHAHLIPRYPFNDTDRRVYIESFLDRDGGERIARKVIDDDIGGFWHIADRERNPMLIDMSDSEKAEILGILAVKLRIVAKPYSNGK